MSPTARIAPEFAYPPYSYVSGHWPHPLRDPAGHSFGLTHSPPVLPDQMEWRRCREYCYAVDLWNAGYYWEAHEQWETLWHAAGRTGSTADFFKGLIKLAAAGVKAREGRPQGVVRHLERAQQLLEKINTQAARPANTTSAERFWGLNVQELLELPKTLGLSLPLLDQEVITKKQPVLRIWDAQLVLA